MNPLFKVQDIVSPGELGQFFGNTVNSSTFGPAPKLVPYSASKGGKIDSTNLSKKLTTINVTNEFPWTHAPPLAGTTPDAHLNPRYDVPSIEMREETILLNPAFNNLARNLFVAVDNVDALQDVYDKFAKSLGQASSGFLGDKATDVAERGVAAMIGAQLASGLNRGLGGVTSGLGASLFGGALGAITGRSGVEKLGDAVQSIGGAIKKDPSKSRSFTSNIVNPTQGDYDQYLKPYQDIYSTDLTGWRYKFPYMEDQQRVNNSAFGEQSIIGAGAVGAAVKATTAFNSIFSPGVYIDTAQNFQFTGLEKSYTVNFPLLNTTNQLDVIRNWQLLFLLTYQNRPNRIDRVQIAPPKIYEVMIPGVWYCRFAYIQNLQVNFVGNRRKMTLHVPIESGNMTTSRGESRGRGLLDRVVDAVGDFVQDKFTSMFEEVTGIDITPDSRAANRSGLNFTGKTFPVTTIVPDAYQVSMTLTELVPESQNTMFAAIRKPNTISVGAGDVNPMDASVGSFPGIQPQ